jgi:hypothetical protein
MAQYTTTYKDMWKYSPATGHWTKVNFELPTDYTVWQSAVSTGPWVSEHPASVMFIAGAGFFNDNLDFSSRSFLFNPQSASVSKNNTSIDQVVFPNPVEAGGSITISNADIAEYKIIDELGRIVKQSRTATNKISTTGIPPGCYTLEVTERISQAKKTYRISTR